MAKNIRFGDLVRNSGRPKTVALWVKPEDNPAAARAIKENRILTVLQESGRKDHGLIGFKVLPGALYLEFPRALPHADDAIVIGINYQLLEEPVVPEKDRVKPARPAPVHRTARADAPSNDVLDLVREVAPREEEPKKPQPQKFSITVRRTASVEDQITVKALDRADAEQQALEKAKRKPFRPGKAVRAEVVK
ncbi:MAG TPA: hypothetical protein VKY92_10225 [Verrucomicrobiae bacterium]|nr:hypothetical protein [Verrucomicrobiae bacterium]